MSKKELYSILRPGINRPSIIDAVLAKSENDALNKYIQNIKWNIKNGFIYAKKPSTVPEFKPRRKRGSK